VSEAAGSPGPAALAALEARLGHPFADRSLLETALVHRSFANEEGLGFHNERLEFLGDAVLGLCAAEWLYRRHPERPEGELARAKSALVSAGALSAYADRLELGSALRLGVGESRGGGRRKRSLLADALEAVFGAIHLDGGLEAARRVVEAYLEWAAATVEWRRRDPKTELQERVQARGWPLPFYAVVGEEGPEHAKRFACEVSISGLAAGRGGGRTKKEAQLAAAEGALERFAELERDLESSRAGGDGGSGPD